MRSPDPAAADPAALVRPELLAPAGDRLCLRAAVENGANAVYFGLDVGFNARARAANLSLAELPQIMADLHRRGVRGYVALNTLAFPGELPALEQTVRAVAQAGADAVLVQDLGVVRLVRAVCPDLAVHASTQMTLTSAECIREAQALGIERVVLARELSLDEIRQIRRETDVPLEVFVHGALCVAYSGQCLTSESLGGRSANRGQCAQACRLPYELVCDGRDVDLGEVRYLLSPQDLAAYALLPELVALGVAAFKIEGRLKTPEYVANITRHYRRAIDAALAVRPVEFSPRHVAEMELSFSRGFSPGWLAGCDHKRLVPGTSSAKRGVRLGAVTAVRGGRVRVALVAGVKRGDGVAFGEAGSQDDEQGGRVYEVWQQGRSARHAVERGEVELTFGRGALDWSRLRVGQTVWKTDDPELTARLRKSFSAPRPQRRLPIDVAVEAAVGARLRATARTSVGAEVAVESDAPLPAATRHPLSAQVLREQLGRLGGTAYVLGTLEARIDGAPMAPLSVLGALRHRLVALLDKAATAPRATAVASEPVLEQLRAADQLAASGAAPVLPLPLGAGGGEGAEIGRAKPHSAADRTTAEDAPSLHVLCRSLHQLRAAVAAGARSAAADFQDIREYRDAVALAHAAGARILLATPRIHKPGETGIFRALARHGADGILVRNLAALAFCAERGVPAVADYSLNAANDLAVAWLVARGAARVTASYDLNRDQIADLVALAPPERLEIVVHHHMPMFHMEHCVFCAVLSPGTNQTNCGRPCDAHEVRLRDRIGSEHPLVADVGCRNTLFNAVPQSAAEVVPQLLAAGVRHFRIELVHDAPASEIAATIGLYRALLAGERTGREVWSRLRAANRLGVTRGTLEERRNPLAII